jgi:fluoride exporter
MEFAITACRQADDSCSSKPRAGVFLLFMVKASYNFLARRTFQMKTASTIAIFCAGGGLTRYYLSGWVYSQLGRAFPFGTFVVNIIGAYFIGLVMELSLRSTAISVTMRLGLTVGFMGGLTTFSTFSYETLKLMEEGQFIVAFANVLASVVVCLLFTWLGIITVRAMTQGGL